MLGAACWWRRVVRDGEFELYRSKVRVSFKYEGHG
jgi:hypothetical protein